MDFDDLIDEDFKSMKPKITKPSSKSNGVSSEWDTPSLQKKVSNWDDDEEDFN